MKIVPVKDSKKPMPFLRVGIVSIGIGNVASVANMIRSQGIIAEILEAPSKGSGLDAIVLPGVGAFDAGMSALRRTEWDRTLKKRCLSTEHNNQWLIGICLGMQLLCDRSDEGDLPGLGLIPGHFRKFSGVETNGLRLKVPHMGWNTVQFDRRKAPWAIDFPDDPRFYFVHSYYCSAVDDDYVIGTTSYGGQFASAIARDRVIGFQFHPEKSHRFGKALLGSLFRHILAQKGE